METQNLAQGQGFVIIKDQEIQVISNYTKLLHKINLNSWTDNLQIIQENIEKLDFTHQFPTLMHNFKSLAEEIENIIPHNRNKRGLINILGKGLKYITGVMDSEDEQEIKDRLKVNEQNNHNLVKAFNDQVKINDNFDETMKNVTEHINKQQNRVKEQLDQFSNLLRRDTKQIEIIQHVFQIQYDIQLLREQVRKVKENLLLSQIGLLSRDILTINEIENYNITIKDMMNIKSSVIVFDNHIIFVLLLPNYEDSKYYRIFVEPVPNRNKLELDIDNKSFIIKGKELYEDTGNTVVRKNLKLFRNSCQIFKDNAQCNFKKNENLEIKQITNNIVITKNIPNTIVKHNCNKFEIILSGNNLIKFENCKININNITYENFVNEDNFVIPNFNNVSIKNILTNFSIADLHLRHLQNRERIEEIKSRNALHEHIAITTTSVVIIFLITILLIWLFKRNLKKNVTDINIELKTEDSSEPNRREGVVTSWLDSHMPENYNLPFANTNSK